MSPSVTPSALPALQQLPEWQAFIKAGQASVVDPDHLRVLEAAGLSLDLTGQATSSGLADAGQALLAARGFNLHRSRLFSGEPINNTEDRAAWCASA